MMWKAIGEPFSACSARIASRTLSVTLVLSPLLTQAQDNYPSRPVRIIVPSAPGGSSDISARLIAQRLSDRWSRPVVVENRAGAGTIIGTELVARAPADGYTLLMAPGAFATLGATYKKLPFDATRDFAPITQTLQVPNLLVAHPSLPAHNLQALIALARARPGEIFYGSAGYGTQPHLTMELFLMMAQIRMGHVAYKGGTSGNA
jgi:tripartite-type tricarboxylate transporter receptor subunit TctC